MWFPLQSSAIAILFFILSFISWARDDYYRAKRYFFFASFQVVLVISMLLMDSILDSKIGFLLIGILWGVIIRQAFIWDHRWKL